MKFTQTLIFKYQKKKSDLVKFTKCATPQTESYRIITSIHITESKF